MTEEDLKKIVSAYLDFEKYDLTIGYIKACLAQEDAYIYLDRFRTAATLMLLLNAVTGLIIIAIPITTSESDSSAQNQSSGKNHIAMICLGMCVVMFSTINIHIIYEIKKHKSNLNAVDNFLDSHVEKILNQRNAGDNISKYDIKFLLTSILIKYATDYAIDKKISDTHCCNWADRVPTVIQCLIKKRERAAAGGGFAHAAHPAGDRASPSQAAVSEVPKDPTTSGHVVVSVPQSL